MSPANGSRSSKAATRPRCSPARCRRWSSSRASAISCAVLAAEVNLRTAGPAYVDKAKEPQSSLDYRNHLASEGLASDIVSAGYQWAPGGELMRKAS